jgi:glycosyltransferase involved in cell wall biosynthesis
MEFFAVLFSLIIPAYKPHHLRQAIQSVLAQSYDDYELIVVDDSSPHELKTELTDFYDHRMHYHRTPHNLGAQDPSRTWNYALQFGKGELIILLGDDDELAPNYLEEMKRLADRHPNASIYRARLQLTDENGLVVDYGWPLPEVETWDEFLYFRHRHGRLQSTSEMAVRASRLREMGGYVAMPLALGSDDHTWLRLSVKHPIISTNRTYARWRRHAQSISGSVWSEKKQKPYLHELYRRIILFLNEHEPLAINSELLKRVIQERYQKTLPPPPKVESKPGFVPAKTGKVAFLPTIAAKLLRIIRKSVKSPSENSGDDRK